MIHFDPIVKRADWEKTKKKREKTGNRNATVLRMTADALAWPCCNIWQKKDPKDAKDPKDMV